MARPIGSFKSLPSYRRHRSSNQAIVTLSGQTHYLGKWNSAASRANYDRLLAEWIASGRQPLNSTSRTVSEICAAFWEFAQTYYIEQVRGVDGKPASLPDGTPQMQPSGELENYRMAMRPLRRLYGNQPAEAFGPLALEAVRRAMVDQGWCRSTVNRQVNRLRRVFAWAVSKELIPASVYQALLTVAGLRRGHCSVRESEPVRPVSESHIDTTIPFLSPHPRAMLQLQRCCGARSGELCRLQTCDIDTAVTPWRADLSAHKTAHHGKQRTLHFGPRARDILRPLLKQDLQAFIFSPADSEALRHAEMREHSTVSATQIYAERDARIVAGVMEKMG